MLYGPKASWRPPGSATAALSHKSKAVPHGLDDDDFVIGRQFSESAALQCPGCLSSSQDKSCNPRLPRSRGLVRTRSLQTGALMHVRSQQDRGSKHVVRCGFAQVQSSTKVLACSRQDQASREHESLWDVCAAWTLCDLPIGVSTVRQVHAAGLLLSSAVALKFDGVVFNADCLLSLLEMLQVMSWQEKSAFHLLQAWTHSATRSWTLPRCSSLLAFTSP